MITAPAKMPGLTPVKRRLSLAGNRHIIGVSYSLCVRSLDQTQHPTGAQPRSPQKREFLKIEEADLIVGNVSC